MGWRVCVRRECSPKLEIVVRRSLGSKGASSGGTRREKECSAPPCHHFTTLPPCHPRREDREGAGADPRQILSSPSRAFQISCPSFANSLHADIRAAPNPLNQSLIYYLVPRDFGIVLLSWFEVCLRICFNNLDNTLEHWLNFFAWDQPTHNNDVH